MKKCKNNFKKKCYSSFLSSIVLDCPSFECQSLSKALPWRCYACPVVPQVHRWCEEPGGQKANFPKRTSNFTKHISTSATDVQFWWIYDVFDVFLWLPYLFLFFPSGWDIQNPGKHRQVLASKFASNSGQFFSGLRIRQNRWKNFTWPLGR